MVWELGYIIAVPAVLFAFGGRMLDKSLDTSPFLLMAGLGLALMLSMAIIYRKVEKLLDIKRKT